ncbi:RNA-binding protein [Strigomonas culicis]|uniref:RNA-binding protein n=1 Tax=Strigomonas culicis TaxID=28005 RepID=S9TPW7_9TRYP|nr:RNA-binding protein [Strigomonas culicis]|eukprot:EPY18518.1 RNA-binding protein [Strigomonas culicis]
MMPPSAPLATHNYYGGSQPGAPPPPPQAPYGRGGYEGGYGRGGGGGYGNDYAPRGGYEGGYGRGGGYEGGYGRGGGGGYEGDYAPREDYGRYRRDSDRDRDRGRRRDRPPREESRREATNTVWVGNLEPSLHTEATMRRVFRPYGKVMRVARHLDKNFCFVHFRQVEEARVAVEALTQSRELRDAHFNYGRMYEYTPEEMAAPYDPNAPDEDVEEAAAGRPERPRRDRDRDGERPARRARTEQEPTNVLWVGSLPAFVSDAKLREVFEPFGPISHISRVDRQNMGFIYYDTVEQCTMALQSMTGQPIESGVVLALNYGHAQNKPQAADVALTPDGIPVSEVPSNVIYLGQLPADTTEEEVEDLLSPFEGFINSRYVETTSIGFGHYDTVEHARVARIALNEATLHGVPIRVNFGRHQHTLTLADKQGDGAGEDFNLDAMMQQPGGGLDGTTGAVVAGTSHTALTLPAMGSTASPTPADAAASAFDRERAAPEVTLDVLLQSLQGTTYGSCGAKDLELGPSQTTAICEMVDRCGDEETEAQLDKALQLYLPLHGTHVFHIVAKRMKDYFEADPHKRLLVLYAATRVLLGVVTDYVPYTETTLNAYLMVLLAASEGQTKSGVDRISTIVESLRQHSFIERKAKVRADYVAEFRAQLDEITNRVKAEQDLASLLTRRKRR